MNQLFSSFDLAGLSLRNRILVSPMCQYSAADGCATDWHMIHLGHLALSGAALLFTEATAVSAAGRISPDDLGLWSDANEAALAPVVTAIRKYSEIKLGMQLAHAGRKASTRLPWEGGGQIPPNQGGWQTLAPSPLPFAKGDMDPHALDAAELQRIAQEFASAAQRVRRLGLDTIEVHSAHGYLLHQFLSPLSNQRNDAFGGTLEKRMRFPLQVFEAVRAAVPKEMPVGVRISATDWVDGGWDIEQSVVYARELKARGCAYIDVSSGGLSPLQKIPVEPGYQVPFAERIRRETGLVTIAIGLITEPQQAETIITSGQADLVSLARGMLYDPRWPWHAAAKLGEQVVAPNQYLRSTPIAYPHLFKQ